MRELEKMVTTHDLRLVRIEAELKVLRALIIAAIASVWFTNVLDPMLRYGPLRLP